MLPAAPGAFPFLQTQRGPTTTSAVLTPTERHGQAIGSKAGEEDYPVPREDQLYCFHSRQMCAETALAFPRKGNPPWRSSSLLLDRLSSSVTRALTAAVQEDDSCPARREKGPAAFLVLAIALPYVPSTPPSCVLCPGCSGGARSPEGERGHRARPSRDPSSCRVTPPKKACCLF